MNVGIVVKEDLKAKDGTKLTLCLHFSETKRFFQSTSAPGATNYLGTNMRMIFRNSQTFIEQS